MGLHTNTIPTRIQYQGEGEGEGEAIMNPSNIRAPITMEFDSYKGYDHNYKDFIQEIRDKLKISDWYGIPYLRRQQRPETPKNTEWLDIKLVAMKDEITVKVQQTNLYIRGYKRTGTTDTFFWEFNDAKLIIGAKDLKFSGSYAGGLDKEGKIRETLPLGYQALQNAIHELAKLARPDLDHQKAGRFLLVLIQMIAEASRYKTISEHIYNKYYDGKPVDGRMIALENGWDKLSTAVFQTKNPTPTTKLPGIEPTTPTKVVTWGDAVAAIGMLLDVRTSGGRMITMIGGDYGRCLMNLEYVRVNGEGPGSLFGTVVVHDGWYKYTFYGRSSGNYETVGPGGFATLTDPCHPHGVSGADAFIISVDLFGHNRKIVQGEIVWDNMIMKSLAFGNYDKHLQQVVKGEYGDVTVGYSVLSNALGVTVQVLLGNNGGKSTAGVYGTLRASQVLGGSTPITLFNKSPEGCVKVSKGHPVPLTRKVIAASMSTVLTITADLLDHHPDSPDAVMARGSVDFTVKHGTYTAQCGSVKLIITCE